MLRKEELKIEEKIIRENEAKSSMGIIEEQQHKKLKKDQFKMELTDIIK